MLAWLCRALCIALAVTYRFAAVAPAGAEENFKPLEFPLEIEPRFTPILNELRRYLAIATKIVASERDRQSVCRTTNFDIARTLQIPGVAQDERALWALGEVTKELRYLCVHPSKNTAMKDDLHAHMEIIKNVLDSYELSSKKSVRGATGANVPSKLPQSAAALYMRQGNTTNQSGVLKGKVALLRSSGMSSKNSTNRTHPTAFNRPPVRPEEIKICGKAMSLAWNLHNGDTTRCSSQAVEALHQMRNLGEKCSQVRWNSDASGPEYATSYRALLREWDTWCGKKGCEAPCQHGRCQRDIKFPFDPGCQCDETWEGPTCSKKSFENGVYTHLQNSSNRILECHPPCQNGASCVKGKCDCPAQFAVNGTIREGLSGPSCEKSEYWFGESCNVCVDKGGSWCLKDGICVTGKDQPTKDICPNSVSGSTFIDQTPLVVKSSSDPCQPEYRKCAAAAAPVVHFINDPTAFGGSCSKEAEARVKGMEEHLGDCNNTAIGSLQLKMGELSVNQTYGEILAHAKKKRKHCENYHAKSMRNQGEDKEQDSKKESQKINEASKNKDSGTWYPIKWASDVISKVTGNFARTEDKSQDKSIVVDSGPLDDLGHFKAAKFRKVVSVKEFNNTTQNNTQEEHKVVSVTPVQGSSEEPKIITVTRVKEVQNHSQHHQVVEVNAVKELQNTTMEVRHDVVSVKTIEEPADGHGASVDTMQASQSMATMEKHHVNSDEKKQRTSGKKQHRGKHNKKHLLPSGLPKHKEQPKEKAKTFEHTEQEDEEVEDWGGKWDGEEMW